MGMAYDAESRRNALLARDRDDRFKVAGRARQQQFLGFARGGQVFWNGRHKAGLSTERALFVTKTPPPEGAGFTSNSLIAATG